MGKTIYDKHRVESGPVELVAPIGFALVLVSEIEADIVQQSQVGKGTFVTPKRMAVAGAAAVMLLLVVIASNFFSGGEAAFRRELTGEWSSPKEDLTVDIETEELLFFDGAKTSVCAYTTNQSARTGSFTVNGIDSTLTLKEDGRLILEGNKMVVTLRRTDAKPSQNNDGSYVASAVPSGGDAEFRRELAGEWMSPEGVAITFDSEEVVCSEGDKSFKSEYSSNRSVRTVSFTSPDGKVCTLTLKEDGRLVLESNGKLATLRRTTSGASKNNTSSYKVSTLSKNGSKSDGNRMSIEDRFKSLVNQVKPGMSKQQVEEILGIADESDEKDMGDLNPRKAGQILDVSTWQGDDESQSSIILGFVNGNLQDGGTSGCDIQKGFSSKLPANLSPSERARLKDTAAKLGMRVDGE